MRPFLGRGNKHGRAFDKDADQRRARARVRKPRRMRKREAARLRVCSRFAQRTTEVCWRQPETERYRAAPPGGATEPGSTPGFLTCYLLLASFPPAPR